MGKTMFFLNKRRSKDKEKKFALEHGLKLCYNQKNEQILKNDEMLVSYNKKYVFVIVYDNNNASLITKINNHFCNKSKERRIFNCYEKN